MSISPNAQQVLDLIGKLTLEEIEELAQIMKGRLADSVYRDLGDKAAQTRAAEYMAVMLLQDLQGKP